MSSICATIFMALFVAVLCLFGLAFLGSILVKQEIMTADTLKRGIAAIAVFGAISSPHTWIPATLPTRSI